MTVNVPVCRGGSTRRQPVASQMTEMLTLQAIATERALTNRESERLGMLVYREQQRARYRPARIERLRAELALLETLQIAERGASAEGCSKADPVELRQRNDGSWAAPARLVA